eukprot:352112-Chlamydomonas_euryale.AAC.3
MASGGTCHGSRLDRPPGAFSFSPGCGSGLKSRSAWLEKRAPFHRAFAPCEGVIHNKIGTTVFHRKGGTRFGGAFRTRRACISRVIATLVAGFS